MAKKQQKKVGGGGQELEKSWADIRLHVLVYDPSQDRYNISGFLGFRGKGARG